MSELVEIRWLDELRPFDMIDEGVYVQSIHFGGGMEGAYAMPTAARAEWVPQLERCFLRAEYDIASMRWITSSSLPIRVIRDGPEPPTRCDLPVPPCGRCPRRRA